MAAILFILLVQANIAGTWSGEVKSSVPPLTPVTITFAMNGNELSGTIRTQLLFQTLERSIKGTVEGNKISFKEVPVDRREFTPRTTALNSYAGSINGDELVLTRTRYEEKSRIRFRIEPVTTDPPQKDILDPGPATLILKRTK